MVTARDELTQDTSAGAASSGSSFFTILWRRKALIIFGVAVGLVAGTLYYLQKAPTYQSTVRVVVFKRRADTMPGQTQGSVQPFIEDYISTQEALLKGRIIWDRAIAKLKNETFKDPPPNGDFLGYIQNGLSVARDKDSNSGATNNVLNIGFKSPAPEDCPIVVNAIIEAYRDYLSLAALNLTQSNIDLVNKGIEQATQELKDADKEYIESRMQIKGSDRVRLEDLKIRYNQIFSKKLEHEAERNSMMAKLDLIAKSRSDGFSDESLVKLLRLTELVSRDVLPAEKPVSRDDVLFQLKVQMEELLGRVGKDHPDVVALQRRIDLIKDFLVQHNTSATTAAKDKGTTVNPVDLYLKFILQQIHAHDVQIKVWQTQLNQDSEMIDTLGISESKQNLLKEQRERVSKKLYNFNERKQQIDLVRDAPLFDATIITQATPGGKVSPVLLTTLAFAGFSGLLIGGGLAYLAEVSDKSFRTIEEVRERLGLTVIGQVPALTAYEPSVIEEHPIDPFLVVHHAPKSVQSEAYRGVRTSLYFSTRGKGHQVIQVTSPNPGDGKSTLAANLATSIAQSGKRVLLIDADFRKPRVHKIFGLGNAEVGLASVIAGEAGIESAIYSCEVPGLSILPCGPRPANPADLLTSALFSEILDEIKKDYDFVLIDTPPVLAVSDPSVVAPRVDGVILTIRMTKSSRPMAEQAKDRLQIIGGNILGVVINGMDDLRPSYGYGYGYGYAYAYGDEPETDSTSLDKPKSR